MDEFKINLANLLGLNINDIQHTIAIDTALIGISSPVEFYQYCERYKNNISQYDTKAERITTLSRRYRRSIEEEKLPYGTANTFSDRIIKKLAISKSFIKNELEKGRINIFSRLIENLEVYFWEEEVNLLKQNFKNETSLVSPKKAFRKYFGRKEINLLEKIGSETKVVELLEIGILKEEMIKIFMSQYKKVNNTKILSIKQNSVLALASSIGRAV